MDHQPLTIRAEWDAEARVWWIAESSFPGLTTEAPSLDARLARAREALTLLLEASAEGPDHPPLHLTAVAA